MKITCERIFTPVTILLTNQEEVDQFYLLSRHSRIQRVYPILRPLFEHLQYKCSPVANGDDLFDLNEAKIKAEHKL